MDFFSFGLGTVSLNNLRFGPYHIHTQIDSLNKLRFGQLYIFQD